MRHPELVFLAAERCHVHTLRVIYDAFDKRRLFISARTLSAVHDQFIHSGEIPLLVEDYALSLLAKHERETKLPNNYSNWLRR